MFPLNALTGSMYTPEASPEKPEIAHLRSTHFIDFDKFNYEEDLIYFAAMLQPRNTLEMAISKFT